MLKIIQFAFWIIYLTLPGFTGWFYYDFLPGEAGYSVAFEWHREEEAKRLFAPVFMYGLIGCFFYGAVTEFKGGENFVERFGIAVLVNIGFTIMFFYAMKH